MNLRQVRLKFRDISGRYDLVSADGTDLGADFFINAGIRHLDRRSNFQKSVGRYFAKVAAGVSRVDTPRTRAITEVWAATREERWQLELKRWQDLRASYTEPWASITTGVPRYYSPTYLRPVPEKLTNVELTALDWVTGYMDVVTDGTHELYNSVLVLPPLNAEMMIEVVGLFYSDALSLDTDTNMWTDLWPELVVQAACLELEKVHRNTQGVQDWTNALEMSLVEIDKDGVEELTAGNAVMEG